mmetsp:Transcript_14640/g.46684  ORF Transcript_14640/g.46684 Transcript_14640/m.46684 type:complete len:231 (-) Transcript_14640:195-887(-)
MRPESVARSEPRIASRSRNISASSQSTWSLTRSAARHSGSSESRCLSCAARSIWSIEEVQLSICAVSFSTKSTSSSSSSSVLVSWLGAVCTSNENRVSAGRSPRSRVLRISSSLMPRIASSRSMLRASSEALRFASLLSSSMSSTPALAAAEPPVESFRSASSSSGPSSSSSPSPPPPLPLSASSSPPPLPCTLRSAVGPMSTEAADPSGLSRTAGTSSCWLRSLAWSWW